MKKLKTAVLLLLAICLLAGLCACSNNKPAEGNTPSGGSAYVADGNTVKLEYGDGVSRPYTVIVAEGSTMAEPAKPLRKGYDFAGWSETEGGSKVSFPYSPKSGATTLYANWESEKFTVTFDWNDGVTAPVTLTKEYNGTLTAAEVPANSPERQNYVFRYFTASKDSADEAVFPVTVKANTTYYGYWIDAAKKIYTVSFSLGYEGQAPEAIEVEEGESITKRQVADPTRDNYSFVGWSETEGGEAITFPYTPAGDVTLHAIWQRPTFRLVFRNEYPGAPSSRINFKTMDVEAGDAVEKPADEPTRSGYIFEGWFTTSSGGEMIQWPLTVTKITSVYAHWKHEPVETDIFQAEYVYLDATEKFPGYSGEATGKGIISSQTTEVGLTVDESLAAAKRTGYYVTYLYKPDATLTFVINSDKAVSGVTLKAVMSVEMQASWEFKPTGDSAYRVVVNGKDLEYGTIGFYGNPAESSTNYKAPFTEFTLGTIDLVAGENTIQLITANSNTAFGGTMRAVAPMVDCIKLENHGDAKLSWAPVYDNLP